MQLSSARNLKSDCQPDRPAGDVLADLVARHQPRAGNDSLPRARIEFQSGAERQDVLEAEDAIQVAEEPGVRELEHIAQRPFQHAETSWRTPARPDAYALGVGT